MEPVSMGLSFTRVRAILFEVPNQGKLAYCLLRDARVPAAPKAALLGTLGLIVSPVDLPGWVPLVGEFDMLALGLLAVKVFVDAAPEELVREHQVALRVKASVFDHDLGTATATLGRGVRQGMRQVVERWRGPTRMPEPLELEE
ncbi:MAG: hypothetical protein LBJ87_02455 [bacterium]|nr:hypothetical protein [bacterium]